MEPLFTNKTTFSRQNMVEVNLATSSRILRNALFFGMGLLIFLGGLLSGEYVFCLLGVIFGIFYPLFSLWAVRHSAANKYQQFQELYHSELETVSRFYDDHLDVHNVQDGADITVAYPQIAKVYETRHAFFLMLSTRIGFLLAKQGFEGMAADEFGRFIRARAVGEGQIALKKRKWKAALVLTILFLVVFAIGLAVGFLGDAIRNAIPRTFTNGSYSIRLTRAFEEYDDEWTSPDATVYCFHETKEELKGFGSVYENAAAYLQDMNDAYDIDSIVIPVSDSRAWAAYIEKFDGQEFFYYDYVIMSGGDFWHTEFSCLATDAGHYQPLFEKWAQTIRIRS